jgi:hypothetical protein
VVYRGTDNDIHQLYNNGTQWAHQDLSILAGAPPAAGDPFEFQGLSGKQLVDYRGTDGHIYQLYISYLGHWVHTDLTALTNAPLSSGDPFQYQKGSYSQIIPFRGVDNDIHQLYTINNNTQWVQTDASARGGAPAAASDAIGYVSGIHYMDYRGADNHIHQLFVPGTQWATADLTNLAGAPLAIGDPFANFFKLNP